MAFHGVREEICWQNPRGKLSGTVGRTMLFPRIRAHFMLVLKEIRSCPNNTQNGRGHTILPYLVRNLKMNLNIQEAANTSKYKRFFT
jgi:hypothetical protein